MSACGAVVTVLRSCFQADYVVRVGSFGTPTLGRYWFIPPGLERWTLSHHMLDPPIYWHQRLPDPLGPNVLMGPWDRGDPPFPYPPPCIDDPSRFWPDIHDTYEVFPVSTLCHDGCECGGINPMPQRYWVDLREFGVFPTFGRAYGPALYRVEKHLSMPCDYRGTDALFLSLAVGFTVLDPTHVQVDALVSVPGLTPYAQTYRGVIHPQKLWRRFTIPKLMPPPGLDPRVPELLPLLVQWPL